jgi:rod shape-determining protein MreC
MAPIRKNLKNIIILSVIIVICIIVITVSFREADLFKRARSGTLDFFKPVQENTYLFFQPVARFFNGIGDYFDLDEAVRQLEIENSELRKDYSENINLKIENNALRKLIGIKLREEHDTETAKVIGYYYNNWQSEIIINVGATDGVSEGMAVVNDKGLVGIIILSSNHTSQVRLLDDPQSTVGARVLSSRKLGMVEGSHEKITYLNYIPSGEVMIKGDILVTSEFGEYIPPELLIGRIKAIGQSGDIYYRQIEVEPFVDFKDIEYVLVIKD